MTVPTRRSWRAAPLTLALAWLSTGAAALGTFALAYLLYERQDAVLLPAVLGVLTVATVTYGWRYGFHPRIVATETELVVRNPWSTHRFRWRDLTLVAPGENGLIVGSEDDEVAAWCVQKSTRAVRRSRRTRADRVVAEILDLLDLHEPPLEDPRWHAVIRRARPDESRMLTRMERAAGEAELSHVFPPDRFPYPVADVTARWRRLLRDRTVAIRVLEVQGEPIGYLAYDSEALRHLGVLPEHMRHGFGSWLLAYATADMFDRGVARARLWVLGENATARRFYAARGWRESSRRRRSEFPPHPEEVELLKDNPTAPRRAVKAVHEHVDGGVEKGRQHR